MPLGCVAFGGGIRIGTAVQPFSGEFFKGTGSAAFNVAVANMLEAHCQVDPRAITIVDAPESRHSDASYVRPSAEGANGQVDIA